MKMRKLLLFFFSLVALRYGTCFDEQKRSHVTYVIAYVPMNPLQFCVLVVHKISCDLRYSFVPMNPIQFVYQWYTKSHATYIIVYVPMNPLQFCVPVVHKISCDLRYSLCLYESITILCIGGTQNLMRLYTCSSCHNRFLSTSVLIHQPHALNVPVQKTNFDSISSNFRTLQHA